MAIRGWRVWQRVIAIIGETSPVARCDTPRLRGRGARASVATGPVRVALRTRQLLRLVRTPSRRRHGHGGSIHTRYRRERYDTPLAGRGRHRPLARTRSRISCRTLQGECLRSRRCGTACQPGSPLPELRTLVVKCPLEPLAEPIVATAVPCFSRAANIPRAVRDHHLFGRPLPHGNELLSLGMWTNPLHLEHVRIRSPQVAVPGTWVSW